MVIDEVGNAEEEIYTDTESISLYETMAHTLGMLTQLDSKETAIIMINVLQKNVRIYIYNTIKCIDG